MLQPFSSMYPPGLTKLRGKLFIVPGFIEVPLNTTIADVKKVWIENLPKPGPGMYCSTEDLIAYRNGTYKEKKIAATEIHEQVLSSDSKKTYNVTFKNNTWSCDCVGFSYRKRCKHIDEIKEKHKK